MFIINEHGEVVNSDKIIAFTVFDDNLSHGIRVYTPATQYGVYFGYATSEELQKSLWNLGKLLMPVEMRWVKFAHWNIAASKIESISPNGCHFRVRMTDGANFDIIGHSHAEHKRWKAELTQSLRENWALYDLMSGEVVGLENEER